MTSRRMNIPRSLLLFSWVALTLLSYCLLLLFSNLGNYFHGGGPADRALLDAFAVLAAFLALDVIIP